jgi:hypothetical protein
MSNLGMDSTALEDSASIAVLQDRALVRRINARNRGMMEAAE